MNRELTLTLYISIDMWTGLSLEKSKLNAVMNAFSSPGQAGSTDSEVKAIQSTSSSGNADSTDSTIRRTRIISKPKRKVKLVRRRSRRSTIAKRVTPTSDSESDVEDNNSDHMAAYGYLNTRDEERKVLNSLRREALSLPIEKSESLTPSVSEVKAPGAPIRRTRAQNRGTDK